MSKPPRSYQPGRLLNLVVREFGGFQSRRLADDQVELVAPKGLTFIICERLEKRFMAYTVTTEFCFSLPGAAPGDGELHLSHTGIFKRTGLRVQVKRSGEAAGAVARRLTGSQDFGQAILPLDFQYFHLRQDANGWHAFTGQVGAAWVVMTFPPTRRYIPLGPDQVAALVGVFEQLQTLFAS